MLFQTIRGTNSLPDEGALRRSLFENTGGSFPELITRGDIKLFLPRTYFRISRGPFGGRS